MFIIVKHQLRDGKKKKYEIASYKLKRFFFFWCKFLDVEKVFGQQLKFTLIL